MVQLVCWCLFRPCGRNYGKFFTPSKAFLFLFPNLSTQCWGVTWIAWQIIFFICSPPPWDAASETEQYHHEVNLPVPNAHLNEGASGLTVLAMVSRHDFLRVWDPLFANTSVFLSLLLLVLAWTPSFTNARDVGSLGRSVVAVRRAH